ncbi:hypothetical protein LCGC14_0391430 [marine sediment metagenome]|uniref:Uncharacterized protein n=1 Tax=marine sediment metagenome TaxID=412755 RepID=A0A0F9THH4_9ZZZZ
MNVDATIVGGDVDWDDYDSLTVSTDVVQVPAGLRDHERAHIVVESASVRFRFDGGDPTATDGIQADAGDTIELESQFEVAKFRVIRKDGSDSTLRIHAGMLV